METGLDRRIDGSEFNEQESPIKWKEYQVAVFAASSPKDRYAVENSEAVGRLLATRGFDAINGGYDVGGMGALGKGFADACREKGLSDSEIEKHLTGVIFSDKVGGKKLKEERGLIKPARFKETDNLAERAGGIINDADAYIATEGGIGTVIELLLAAQNEWARQKDVSAKKRPIILIDKDQAVDHVLESMEKIKPGSASTLGKDIFVLAGHHAPKQGELPMATLKNDEVMAEQLDKLLEFSYLTNQADRSADQDQLLEARRQELFEDKSPWRVLSIGEHSKLKQEFSEGAGI